MIVSHTHRYIFIKSLKTAGTSIEAALSAHCQGNDIVTTLGDYSFNRDEGGRWVHHAMNSEGFEQHDDAATVKTKLGEELWNSYLKFSITRNPWDRTVSLFFWEKKRNPKTQQARTLWQWLGIVDDEHSRLRREFRQFVREGAWENNDRFYILGDRLCVDYMIRYEHLQEDMNTLCQKLGLPDLQMPRLKAGIRNVRGHYSSLYDEETAELVRRKHRYDIELFGYTFEPPAE